MSYFKQFQKRLANREWPSFLSLWEEYCLSDEVNGEELERILTSIKESKSPEFFGQHAEQGLILWEKIKKSEVGDRVFQSILDLQSTDDPELAQIAIDYLEEHYPDDPLFQEKLRLIGLREPYHFQGAISNYILLSHMKKGNFVLHNGGWGMGQITDVSFLREQLSIAFDLFPREKELSFQNAFNTLLPLPRDHFLALRFSDPDALEKRAKKDPFALIHILLRDLGPKTAEEIREALCGYVIPNASWGRWWQTARAKIKKSGLIHLPNDPHAPLTIRDEALSYEERIQRMLEQKPDAKTAIQKTYVFVRDFPQITKNRELISLLTEHFQKMLSSQSLSEARKLEIQFLMQILKQEPDYPPLHTLIAQCHPEKIAPDIEILAFKKQFLAKIRKSRRDWQEIFSELLFSIEHNPLRNYMLNELLDAGEKARIEKRLETLIASSTDYPTAFFWYFQKIMGDSSLPFGDVGGKMRFFEVFLTLFSELERLPNRRDLVKKMHGFLTANRYKNVREIFQKSEQSAVRECLLLSTKCHTLTEQDINILHSLARVVHPELVALEKKYVDYEEKEPIWTTEEGYAKLQKRIEEISTVKAAETAKEIEVARSYGDLRENAEFKAALEKRDRLQSELKLLSGQLGQARILTKSDVTTDEVGIGVIVDCKEAEGEVVSYVILGPWEGDPERGILSFQSRFAQSLMGKKVGDRVTIGEKTFSIAKLRNYFEES